MPAARPPIQAVVQKGAEYDPTRRAWRMVVFNEDGTEFTSGSWAPLPYRANWADQGDPYCPGEYRLVGDRVELRGVAKALAPGYNWNNEANAVICDFTGIFDIDHDQVLLVPIQDNGGTSIARVHARAATNDLIIVTTWVGNQTGIVGSEAFLDGQSFVVPAT